MQNKEGAQKNHQELALSDWLSFLESRANANINVVMFMASILIAIVFGIYLSYIESKSDQQFGIIIGFAMIAVIFISYFYVRRLIKNQRREALIAKDLVEKITLGNLRDPKDIKAEWKKRLKR